MHETEMLDMKILVSREDELLEAKRLADEVGLKIEFRSSKVLLWNDVTKCMTYLPVAYSDIYIDYHIAYARKPGVRVIDFSLVIFHGRNACGIWPISIWII